MGIFGKKSVNKLVETLITDPEKRKEMKGITHLITNQMIQMLGENGKKVDENTKIILTLSTLLQTVEDIEPITKKDAERLLPVMYDIDIKTSSQAFNIWKSGPPLQLPKGKVTMSADEYINLFG